MAAASSDEDGIPPLERVCGKGSGTEDVQQEAARVERRVNDFKAVADLSLYNTWSIILCTIILNMNVIRTDRHGSPLLVLLSKTTKRHIVAIHRPLLEAHLTNLLAPYGFKNTYDWVSSLDSAVLAKGRQNVDSSQLQDLRLLWAVSSKTSMKRFMKCTVFIDGQDLEKLMSKVINSWLFSCMQALWLGEQGLSLEKKCNKNCVIRPGSTTVNLTGTIRNRLSFLVTREESKQLLDKGFAGLQELVQSPILNSADPRIRALPWTQRALCGGWRCVDHDWPLWWEAILRYHHNVSVTNLQEYFMDRSWWKDKQKQHDHDHQKKKRKKAPEAILKQEKQESDHLKRMRLPREEPIVID